ncbi:MAG: hypothetical protein ACPGUX_00865 [Halocynthiibacter sp.]
MIEVNKKLPSGVLLGPEIQNLRNILQEQNAAWFSAEDAYITQESDEDTTWVSGWASNTTDVTAKPSRPNKKKGRFDHASMVPAMCFQSGVHCGYSANGIAPNAERFTVAVIYRSEKRDGRTLFSVAGEDKSNMLFANESSGKLHIVDRSGTILVECDAPLSGTRHALLIASYETGKLRVSLNGELQGEAAGHVPGLGGSAEFFIGCRNHRAGLAKTLGTSSISDAFYWPDRMLLGPQGIPPDPALAALHDFWRWNR